MTENSPQAKPGRTKIFTLDFFKSESSSGIIMITFAALAMIFANSGLSSVYKDFVYYPITFAAGEATVEMALKEWVKDLLMALFFLLVGMEIKYELTRGSLANKKQAILPAIGAIGGMAIPALIYAAFNFNNPETIHGWAIPSATDIAFAVCVLAMVGPKVPAGLKVFLLALAILDDMGAVVIIAFFYSGELNSVALLMVAMISVLLYIINRSGIKSLSIYMALGVPLWVAMFNSGIHATAAGVLLGAFIPMDGKTASSNSPLKSLIHGLHPYIAYIVLPLFAFVSAGIDLSGIKLSYIMDPVPLGVMLGLFIGKQVGVFLLCVALIKTRICDMPAGANYTMLYGTSVLTGIGFTMSLFISLLSFESKLLIEEAKLGIMLGSVLSALWGYGVLKYATSRI